jgi:hypothetical protein
MKRIRSMGARGKEFVHLCKTAVHFFMTVILLVVISVGLSSIHGIYKLSLPSAEAAVNKVNIRYRDMDRNKNGVITRQEWRGSDQSFDEHDWNNDGVLSGEEVATTGDKRGRRESRRAERFERLDENNNGCISRDEWLNAE